MKTYTKIHRLLLGVFAVAALAAFAASPALASSSGVSQNVKLKAHKRAHRLAHRGAPATETVGVSSFGAIKAAAKPTEESSGNCPKSTNLGTANNVGATVSNSGLVSTYTFESFNNEHPVNGVPGLVKYCVYPTPATAPTNITPQAHGDNGAPWTFSSFSKQKGNFSFTRPGGNATNIGLDGTDEVMGTATWATLPTNQTIVLHINDEAECHRLYGEGSSITCFVLPGKRPGPICDQGTGNTLAAYNSMPTSFPPACYPPPAEAFQAQQVSEFGDDVILGKGGAIKSLTVGFQSYACEEGDWFAESCKSPNEKGWKFPSGHVITASIYLPTDPTTPVATATASPEIPFRPGWNEEKCKNPGTDANGGNDIGKWFNEANGYCQYSQSDLIQFTGFTGSQTTFTAGETVIWTVAFDTSAWGYSPIGEVGPWDSLNVGDYTYPNAPYAGENPTPEKIWLAQNTTTPGNLQEGEIECPGCGSGGTNLLTKDLLPLAAIVTE